MFIDQDGGKVGIGTTAPAELLSVVGGNILLGTNAKYIQFVNNGGTQFDALGYDGNNDLVLNTPSDIIFKRNGTQNVRIKSNDDFLVDTDNLYVDVSENSVGINTDTPKATLDIKQSGNDWEDGILLQHHNTDTGWNFHAEDTENALYIGYNSDTSVAIDSQGATAMMTIESGGNVGIGTTSPDGKLHVVGRIKISSGDIEMPAQKIYGAKLNGSGSYTDTQFYSNDGTYWTTDIDGTEYTRLTTTGLGIGTTAPSYKLNVRGGAMVKNDASHQTLELRGDTGYGP